MKREILEYNSAAKDGFTGLVATKQDVKEMIGACTYIRKENILEEFSLFVLVRIKFTCPRNKT